MCGLDVIVFSGGLPHRATETERAAGSTHCLSGKLIPGKMHTPTCWPKMRKATCTKFSVSPTPSSQFILFEAGSLTAFQTNVSFQFIMSSQSAWIRTTNFGECCWCGWVLLMAAVVVRGPEDRVLTCSADCSESSIPVWWLMTKQGLSPPQSDFAHS